MIAAARLLGLLCVLAVLILAQPGNAKAQQVDLALVLAVDVSSSVDFGEFALQMDAYAAAFRTPEIARAVKGVGRNGIAVTLIQWAGDKQHAMALEWTHLTDAESCAAFGAALDGMPRFFSSGATSIAGAIEESMEALETTTFEATRRVIDISGDGPNNQERSLPDARKAALAAKVTINGLAILNDDANLTAYYSANVIGGAGAFVVSAADFQDFAEAIKQKLLREISAVPVADAAHQQPATAMAQ